MGSDLPRSHGGTRGRLSAAEIRSSTTVKSSRITNTAHHLRSQPRQADDTSPRDRSPPSQTKAFRKSPGNHGTPGRSGRRSRVLDADGQMVVKMPVKNLVMEEVTILKRGGLAKPSRPAENRRLLDREETGVPLPDGDSRDDISAALCSTERLGPDPLILPKQIRLVDEKRPMYAGSGFFASPSPRSLPLPTSFFAKKEVASTTDLATRSLRYLLRLDLP